MKFFAALRTDRSEGFNLSLKYDIKDLKPNC